MKYSTFAMRAIGIFALAGITPAAMAHVGPHAHVSGFTAGFLHPWLGADHLLAMVAIGLLAVRAHSVMHRPIPLWLIPAGFVSGMLIGGLASYAELPVPGVELAIATSVILLGAALALLPRIHAVPAAFLVALAGFFHGHAHITEMTGAVVSYTAGMVLATALLHTAGVIGGLALTQVRAEPILRASGAVIACSFTVLLVV